MKPLGTKSINIDHLNIDYYDLGRGKPVMFLHGLTGSASSWKVIIEKLSKTEGFHFIVPDIPGMAYAGKLNLRYSFNTDVDFLFRFIKKITSEKIILVGDSSSGITSILFALQHPGTVEKLILIETPFYFSHAKIKFSGLFLLNLVERVSIFRYFLKKMIDSDRILKFGWKIIWPNNEFLPTFRENRDVVVLRKNSVKAYAQALIDLLKVDLRNEVSKIKTRTLIIGGDSDFWVPKSLLEELAQKIPNSELIILKDVSHGGFEEKTEIIVKRIADFLNE